MQVIAGRPNANISRPLPTRSVARLQRSSAPSLYPLVRKSGNKMAQIRRLPHSNNQPITCSAAAAAGSSIFQEAAFECIKSVGLYMGGAYLALYVFNKVIDKMLQSVKDQRKKVSTERSNTFALEALAIALQQPVRVMLPLASALLSIRECFRFFFKLKPEARTGLAPILDFFSNRITEAELLTIRYSELVLLVIVTWVVMSAKTAIFNRIASVVAETEGVGKAEVERALVPASEMLSWAIGAGAALGSLQLLGVNVQPILLTGGIGGAIAALASQSFLANIVSGINLFVARPFVVGDRIMVKGSINVHGIVEAIDYTRTLVRTDPLLPVLIPNKQLQDAVIINESRAGNTSIRNNYAGPRQLFFQFQLPYRDIDKADKITAEIRRWCREDCDLVDNRYALYSWVTALGDNTCTVTCNMYSTTPASRAFAAFREKVLINIFRIVRSYNASIASYNVIMNYEYDMGSPPGANNGAQSEPWKMLAADAGPPQRV